MRAYPLILVVFAVVLGSGCGRSGVHFEQDFKVDALGNKSFTLPAPKAEQKVAIAFRTSGVKVNAYVLLEKNREDAMERLSQQRALGNNILAKKEGSTDGTLEATIPAGAEFAVILSNPTNQDASVSLKVMPTK
jgi:hypothetical protein